MMCGCDVWTMSPRETPPNHGNCISCGMKIVNAARYGHKTLVQFVREGKTLSSRVERKNRICALAKKSDRTSRELQIQNDLAVMRSLIVAQQAEHK